MSLYAIGMKGFVEIRKALKAPKAIVTEAVIPTKYTLYREQRLRDGTYVVLPKAMAGKRTLRNTVFSGGTVLICLPRMSFLGIVRGSRHFLSVKENEVKRIPAEFEAKVYEKIHSA